MLSRFARFIVPAIAVAGIAGSVAGAVMNHNTTSDLHRTHSTLVSTRGTLSKTSAELDAASRHNDQLTEYLHTAQADATAARSDADAAKAQISVNEKTIENLRTCADGALELSRDLLDDDYTLAMIHISSIKAPCAAGSAAIDGSDDTSTSA